MRNFLKGFVWAFNGLVIFFKHERNGRIQLSAGACVIVLGFFYKVSANEWMVLLGCIALVLSLEMMNSAIEKLCNLVQPTYHIAIKTIKDISAGAVLWASFFSAVMGAIIFVPKVLQWYH